MGRTMSPVTLRCQRVLDLTDIFQRSVNGLNERALAEEQCSERRITQFFMFLRIFVSSARPWPRSRLCKRGRCRPDPQRAGRRVLWRALRTGLAVVDMAWRETEMPAVPPSIDDEMEFEP